MTTTYNSFQQVAADSPINPELGLRITNPEAVLANLGDSFLYAQPVESEASFSRAVAHTVLPNMDSLLADFFEVWEPQELTHGQLEINALETLGLAPGETLDKVSLPLLVAGKISTFSPAFHDIAEVVVTIYAALGEKEVTIAYPRMAHIAQSIGEHALATDGLLAMSKQEARHLSFYVAFSRERWELLKSWQQRAVRSIIEYGYYPVGVQKDNKKRMSGFGKMLVQLEPEKPLDIAKKVENLAASLIHDSCADGAFLQNRYQECIDEI